MRTMLAAVLLAALGGCHESTPTGDAGADAGRPPLGRGSAGHAGNVLLTQHVDPSAATQVLAASNGVKVTLPGGALPRAVDVTVSTLEGAQVGTPSLEEALLGVEVSLGDLHELTAFVTLDLPYDASRLPTTVPPEVLLAPAYFDEAQREWVALPYDVDVAQAVVHVHTQHFSSFLLRLFRGAKDLPAPRRVGALAISEEGGNVLVYEEPGRFAFWFRTADVEANTGAASGWYVHDDATVEPIPGVPPFVKDAVRYFLREADAYRDAGFAQPLRQRVLFADSSSSSRSKLTKDITLRYAIDPAALKLDSAHEYFHSVQNQYFTVVGMSARRWWMEATADYAGDQTAWGGLGQMGGVNYVNPRYLEKPLTYAAPDLSVRDVMQALTDALIREGLIKNDPHADHQYTTSLFVDFLVREKGVSFPALWAALGAASGFDVRAQLDAALTQQVHQSLASCYRDFARAWAFAPTSPVRARLHKGILDVADPSSRRVGDTDTSATVTLSLEGEHSAKVVGLFGNVAGAGRTFRFTATTLPADTSVDVYTSTASEVFNRVGALEQVNATVDATLGGTSDVWLLLVNNSPSAQQLELDAQVVASTGLCGWPCGAQRLVCDNGSAGPTSAVSGTCRARPVGGPWAGWSLDFTCNPNQLAGTTADGAHTYAGSWTGSGTALAVTLHGLSAGCTFAP